jgi:hypothetical protein
MSIACCEKAASDTDRTVSSVVRRLIRALRAHGH